MKPILTAGISLGVLAELLGLVMGVTGIHARVPIGPMAFIVGAIALNIAAVVWGLKQTAPERGYGGQLIAGLLIGVIASTVIFPGSILLTTVILPDYSQEIVTAWEEFLPTVGMDEAQIAAQMEQIRQGQTPVSQALSGVFGTLGTSLVVSLIAGAFLRRK